VDQYETMSGGDGGVLRFVSVLFAVLVLLLTCARVFLVLSLPVFTHENLPITAVPYYAAMSPPPSGWQIDRWGFEHWVAMTEILLFIPLTLAVASMMRPSCDVAYALSIVLLAAGMILEAIKFIVRAVQYGGCPRQPLCINEDPLGDPYVAPVSWHFMIWGSLTYVLLFILLLLAVYTNRRQWRDKHAHKL
jgi:hypothetical protein